MVEDAPAQPLIGMSGCFCELRARTERPTAGGAADHTAVEASDAAVRPRSKVCKGSPFGPLRGPNRPPFALTAAGG